MTISSDKPVMILVVDRESRKVIDVARIESTYRFDEVIMRHDFSKVEMILREPKSTIITEIAEEPFIRPPSEPLPESSVDDNEDVPF